jgi:hypothetical protein
MQLTKRPWNLSKLQRLLIVLCAGLYVVVFSPWSHGAVDGGSVYAGAGAMLVLAVLPSKVRLLSAMALAVAAAFVFFVALRAIGVQA